MTSSMTRLAKILALFALLTGCTAQEAKEPADLVLRNGKVVTVDEALPEAQAVAVKDGRSGRGASGK